VNWLAQAHRAWDRFWFESDGRVQMRYFRAGVGAVLFGCYLVRSLDLEFFFSDSGIVKSSVMPDLLPMAYRYSLFDIFHGTTALWILNGLLLASLLTLTFGIFPRISALIAEIIHISFLHRDMTASYGIDLIAAFFLLYLCFADYGKKGESFDRSRLRTMVGSVVFRLCQIQLCVIYGYSGLQKLRGPTWWKGEGIWAALANSQMARFDFSWVAHFPVALTGASFVNLLWEIYFPILVWVKPLRYPVLIFGVLLHLGISLTINIPFFGFLMIASYALFIDASSLNYFHEKVRNLVKVPQVPGARADENSV
jgi:hypothetical protein